MSEWKGLSGRQKLAQYVVEGVAKGKGERGEEGRESSYGPGTLSLPGQMGRIGVAQWWILH